MSLRLILSDMDACMTATAEPSRTKVLICDDEPMISSVLQAILCDFTVELVGSGREALKKLDTFVPDVILLDVEMRELNGHEVCRRIRANSQFQFVKIVFLSGNVTQADRMAGLDAGGNEYIAKPFSSEELLSKISLLARQKAAEEEERTAS